MGRFRSDLILARMRRPSLSAGAAEGFCGGAVGFVVGGFEDVGDAGVGGDFRDAFGHFAGVGFGFDDAGAGDEKERVPDSPRRREPSGMSRVSFPAYVMREKDSTRARFCRIALLRALANLAMLCACGADGDGLARGETQLPGRDLFFLCSTAAPMKAAKSGCGSRGLDLNSGWNWQPRNHGWSGASTIST